MFFQWLFKSKCGILVISFQEPYDLNCGEQILINKKKSLHYRSGWQFREQYLGCIRKGQGNIYVWVLTYIYITYNITYICYILCIVMWRKCCRIWSWYIKENEINCNHPSLMTIIYWECSPANSFFFFFLPRVTPARHCLCVIFFPAGPTSAASATELDTLAVAATTTRWRSVLVTLFLHLKHITWSLAKDDGTALRCCRLLVCGCVCLLFCLKKQCYDPVFYYLLHLVSTTSYFSLVYILAEMYCVYSLWYAGPCQSGLSEPTVL